MTVRNRNFTTTIISSHTTKTLKASPLNSRGYKRSEHPRKGVLDVTSTLKGSPICGVGAHPFPSKLAYP